MAGLYPPPVVVPSPIKSIQRGVTSITDASKTTVTISSVDVSKAVVLVLRGEGGTQAASPGGRLISATQLELHAFPTDTTTIDWQVVEFN